MFIKGWIEMLSAEYIFTVLGLAGLYCIFTLVLNLQMGYAGIINFGIVSFVGVGGYTYAVLTVLGGFSPIIGVVAAILAGLVLGYITYKAFSGLREEHLAISILAFGELLRYFYINQESITKGVAGIFGIPSPLNIITASLGISNLTVIGIVILVSAGIVFWAVNKISESPLGRLLKAIKSDERICAGLGRNIEGTKEKIWVFGSTIFAIGGVLFVLYYDSTFPSLFDPSLTFLIWTIFLVGGFGSNKGAILGSFLIVFFEEVTNQLMITTGLTGIATARSILYGVLIVLILRFKPGGLLGEEPTFY
ncbi:hypothetical protein AKJ36_00865 [candidate division MSBL1 archaeon SCGC-AAA259I07]|uniref:Branched-chain amino acid ABC transporter permease n=1 Tax=candidate division MSBL1 archaeon SCGC-AAA259I07 TaxID=1698266 RepID=A0A133UM78_9EURY|nr:hypothetical protein AKJ36_00865 [candidate division MSBL1 archaeon SCGC-AAA259I07]